MASFFSTEDLADIRAAARRPSFAAANAEIIADALRDFHRAAKRAGYTPAGAAVLLTQLVSGAIKPHVTRRGRVVLPPAVVRAGAGV